jgi:hypothetical protein
VKYTPNTPGEGSALPDGEYPFEVTDAEEKQSASSGNDMIELILRVNNSATVYDYLTATDGSVWKLDNFRASIGEEVKPGVPIDIDPDAWIGKKGVCILYTDTYQGKKKNKVADYVFVISGPKPPPPPQPPPAPLAPPKNKWR